MPRQHPVEYDRDLYADLQISPRAEPVVVDAAYRALMKQYAPRATTDTNSHAVRLNQAHDVISDAGKRRDYDACRRSSGSGLIGPYRIIKEVAEGGFGVTYKAEHQLVGELSCIKHCSEVSSVAEDILKQETHAIWNLRHFGIPIMRDLFKLDDGSYALAMSWVEGPTIQQVVEKHGKIDAENVAWVAERMLNTLSYLHHHGVIHGDVKPQNTIVQEQNHIVVLVDFGLALVKPTSGTTAKGHTELFSPPEQLSGKTLVPGSDFYSLGMTMLYMLGGSYRAVERKELPASVPDPLCDFIRKLIVRDVLNRPRDTNALFEEFKAVRIKSFGREHSNMKHFVD